MDQRIAHIGIIVEDNLVVEQVNGLLHEYQDYIVGRMGIPYRARGVSIISIVIDAPSDVINALTGKLGNMKGIGAKTLYAKA